MNDDQFNNQNTGFWGAIAGLFWLCSSIIKYLTMRLGKKREVKNMEKVGIKETKELLDGLNELSLEIISVAKDGLQVKDAAQIVMDIMMKPEFKDKLAKAIDGVGIIPQEIKDIDLEEGVELVKFEYDGVKKIMEALKK